MIPKQKELKKLANLYQLDLILLFGSRLTGKMHPESDLDLAFYSHKGLSTVKQDRLLNDLTKITQENKIDLIDLKKASFLLAMNIAKEGRVLFSRQKGLFDDLLGKIYLNYMDFQRFYRWRSELVKNFSL
ncbi:hypothetical protein COT40_01425 [Candidatus Peregrinibacteria bacterium CG08_land_8_20_14_0_20_41_10]|nr:MAG: hypothetical protein COT40_01425 [Candidatus Peregrinibacteria bacterium CG08_land_8_20_14_0_20_41_10]